MLNADNIKISHALPGRIRLRLASIKGNDALARILQRDFLAIPGLTGLTYNTLTGSVLITYDNHRLLADDGIAALRRTLDSHLPGLDQEQLLRWLKSPIF